MEQSDVSAPVQKGGVCFYGDSHLKPFGQIKRDIYGDAYWSTLYLHRDIFNLGAYPIDCGDKFDNPRPDTESILLMEKLYRGDYVDLFGIPAIQEHGVIGNHDCISVDSVAPQHHLSGFNYLNKQLINIGGIRIYGIDAHRSRESELLQEELKAVPPGTDILVLHQLARRSMPDIEGAWNFDETWVPEHVRLVIMGDNHKPLDYTVDNTRFMYTGSTYLTAFGEPLEKSFIHVVPDDSGEFIITRRQIPTRPILSVRFDNGIDLDNFIAQLPQYLSSAEEAMAWFSPFKICDRSERIVDIRKPLIRVMYSVDIPPVEGKHVQERLRAVVADRAYLDLVPFAVDSEVPVFEDMSQATSELVVPELIRQIPGIDPIKDEGIINLATDIITADRDKVFEVLRRAASDFGYSFSDASITVGRAHN